MANILKIVCSFLVAIALLGATHSPAHCSVSHDEMHFEIDGDYIYVVPQSNLLKKIEKRSGRVIWTSRTDSKWYSSGGSYTTPVFFDDRFYTVEMFSARLFSVDCETGHQVMEYKYSFGCSTAEAVFDPLLCHNSLITFSSGDIQARSLIDKSMTWKLHCMEGDLRGVLDYFQTETTLFAFVINSINKSLKRGGASFDDGSSRIEMVELDCATGKVLNRFDQSILFGNEKIKMGWIFEIGEWRGKRLIVAAYSSDSSIQGIRLFVFDPISKSVGQVIENLAHPSDTGTLDGKEIYYHNPVILDDSIFYLGSGEMLIARSLDNGETLWESKKGGRPGAAGGDKLFTHFEGGNFHKIYCRNALTGNPIWSRKIKIPNQHPLSRLYEMKIAGNHLYVLTGAYLRALDVTTGEEIWKVPLRPEEDYEKEAQESTWNGILDFFDGLF